MQKLRAVFLVLACLVAAPAAAQSLALHQSAAPAAPAKPSATIIPGSPLAALTGGVADGAPAADANTPSPFGTTNIGLSITAAIGGDASTTVEDFLRAFRQSTRLEPIADWARTAAASPQRRADAVEIARALAIALIPALAIETALRFALARLRAGVIARAAAVPATVIDDPLQEPAQEDDAGDPDATPAIAGIADPEAGGVEEDSAGDPSRRRRRISFLAFGRRLAFALLHLVLCLAPVFGFALTVQSLLASPLLTTRLGHLAVIGIANAYLLSRFILEALRFTAAPHAASLRFLMLTDAQATQTMRRGSVILATAVIGYAAVSLCELLGLDHTGATVLIRLIALALHIEAALAVWHSRHVVARWIAGHNKPDSFTAGFRHRFAAGWHYLALFYILALWVALAAGVHNAFGTLLRIILVLLAALVFGRLAWLGCTNLLDRLFPDSSPTHPTIFARARAYNPLIRLLFRIIIGFVVILLVLQGWGIDALGWLLRDKISHALLTAFISIVITIAVALIAWEISNGLINSRIDQLGAAGRTRQASRLRTLTPMLKATIGVTLALVAGSICLSRIGVNTAGLLAGAGVLGIAVGFGSQKLVQDIITGLFLLLEDAIQVGDVVSLASMTGTVERLSIRTIRLRGRDGSVNIIPFSAVTTVTNQTRDFGYAQISIQVGYEEDLARVYAVLQDIAKKMRAEAAWGAMMRDDLQIFGLDEFGASALVITGQIRTGPGQHWAVRRQFYARVKKRFEEERIDMPYTYLAPPPPPPEKAPPAAEDATRLPTEPEVQK